MIKTISIKPIITPIDVGLAQQYQNLAIGARAMLLHCNNQIRRAKASSDHTAVQLVEKRKRINRVLNAAELGYQEVHRPVEDQAQAVFELKRRYAELYTQYQTF